MNKISGKVIVKETGVGIPDLLVSIYDLDPDTKPEETFNAIPGEVGSDFWQKFKGDRIGSVLTDEKGRFELTYEDSEFKVRNQEKRPDLILVVTAPEETGKQCIKALHVSCGIRQNAGRTENYLIRLTTEQLEKAGVQVSSPSTKEPEAPEKIIKKLVETEKRKEKINEGIRKEITAKRVDRERAYARNFKEKIKQPLLNSLSKVPEKIRKSESYVALGENVEEKTKNIIKSGIKDVINEPKENEPKERAPIFAHIVVTKEQKDALKKFTDENGNIIGKNVKEVERIESILYSGDEGENRPAFLLREHPLAILCRKKSHEEKCAEEDLGLGEGNEHSSDSGTGSGSSTIAEAHGNGVEPATADDVPKYIARFMEHTTSPEEKVAFGVGKRATQEDVQNIVDAFNIRKGPADTPAFYDFHSLQIAFEHVWQEAIDEGILNIAEDAYKEIVESGGALGTIAADKIHPFLEELRMAAKAQDEEPPVEVIETFDVTKEQWRVLTTDQRKELENLATNIKNGLRYICNMGGYEPGSLASNQQRGKQILKYADNKLTAGLDPFNRLHKLLQELENRMKGDYAFTYYAPNSVNFGIVVTYRQKWEPDSYQAGRLVKTIPLAPKEERKFHKKVFMKKSRSEKEVENSLQIRKTEVSETSRAEAEIISKAHAKTNFSLKTDGSYNIGISKGAATTSFTKDAETTSEEIKKDFREAVFKAAEEYKNERTVEVTTSVSEDTEAEESGVISNPNDEIPVTFLFYELQRRYRVSEQIHKLTSVVFVAQEVPKPHEIDDDWIVAHDWILRRVLLDDSFVPALGYLSTKIVGDEFALEELRKNVEQQRRLLETIKEEFVAVREQVGRRYAALERAIELRAQKVAGESTEGIGEKAWEWIVGSGDEEAIEAARIREESAKEAYEKAAKEEKEARAKLEREVTALQAITEQYTKALSEHLNRKEQIARLRVHIKQNILYYMQAIWSHEPPDQRFFRLHKVQVPVFEPMEKSYKPVSNSDSIFNPLRVEIKANRLKVIDNPLHKYEVSTNFKPEFEFKTLAEVADLDNLLGYKGNYMIFPLKKSNALTEFMMAPYKDTAFGSLGLHDPDDLGNWTLDEFAKYACCLKEKLPTEEFDKIKDYLKEEYGRLLTSPRRSSEDIIVPTDSLFIEALPGTHPILEDFKLMHRAIDVKKVQAEVRAAELENIRAAARLIIEEYEDKDIEKKIVIEGDTRSVIVPPGDE